MPTTDFRTDGKRRLDAPTERNDTSILQPGRNCWRVRPANRAAFLVDGAAYFRHLREALELARHSIMIVGWDFDGDIRLNPVDAPDESLAVLLMRLIKARPNLQVRILIWGFSTYYGANHQPVVSLGEPWHARFSRIEFAFDNEYPLGASHHEKIVCIDDSMAFVGGIDLTAERWDTPTHDPGDPHRYEHDGEPYLPVHDLQLAVDGEAGRAVSQLVRRRWRDATGERISPVAIHCDPWPKRLKADFKNVTIGIARTRPAFDARRAIREIEALNVDALRSAKKSIYLETQYFTAQIVGDVLVDRLQEADGPEVIVVVTKESDGIVEQFAMGANRERMLRRLKAADHDDRLCVYYPQTHLSDGSKQPIGVHSKLIIIDDRLVRIGSSNLNNRSMGADTECDLAIEGRDNAQRAAIARLRNSLLAEHLGAHEHDIHSGIERTGSIIATIELLRDSSRTLCPIVVDADSGASEPLIGTAILDPFEPINFAYLRRVLLTY